MPLQGNANIIPSMSSTEVVATFSEKVPPHDIETEMAVLGSAIMSNVGRMVIMQELAPADFWVDRHRDIFAVIQELDAAGPVDLVLVDSRLRERKLSQRVGGIGYLTSCINQAVMTDHPESYVRILKDKAWRRRLLTANVESREVIEDESYPMDEVQSVVEGKVLGSRERTKDEFDTEVWANDVETQVAMQEAGETGRPVLETGYYWIDRHLRLRPKRLTVLAAATSAGKTAVVTNIAKAIAERGKLVYFWSGEMDEEELHERLAAGHYDIEYERIQDRRLTRDEVAKVKAYATWFKALPFVIRDRPMSVADVRADCRYIASTQGKIDLVVIDYLTLLNDLNSEIEGSDRRDVRVGKMIWSLKHMARELDCHVMVLHQFNREFSKRVTSRPRLSDLRESGQIEHHAYNVVLLYRPDRDESLEDTVRAEYKDIRGSMVEIIIAKQRGGKVGSLWVVFNGDKQRMETLDKGQWPQLPKVRGKS